MQDVWRNEPHNSFLVPIIEVLESISTEAAFIWVCPAGQYVSFNRQVTIAFLRDISIGKLGPRRDGMERRCVAWSYAVHCTVQTSVSGV